MPSKIDSSRFPNDLGGILGKVRGNGASLNGACLCIVRAFFV